MKVVSFVRNGKSSYGVVNGDGIVDVGAKLGSKYPDLVAVLKAGALAEVEAAAKGASADAKHGEHPKVTVRALDAKTLEDLKAKGADMAKLHEKLAAKGADMAKLHEHLKAHVIDGDKLKELHAKIQVLDAETLGHRLCQPDLDILQVP